MVRVDKGKREGRFCTSMAGPGFFDRLCLYPLICCGISGALDQLVLLFARKFLILICGDRCAFRSQQQSQVREH